VEEAGQGTGHAVFLLPGGGLPFAFAGLWENWVNPEGEKVRTCTIITCESNEMVRPVHPRMPVVLTGDDLWKWMDGQSKEELLSVLVPYDKGDMMAHQVSTTVNRPDPEDRS
jgi:putative SOS response-associated peptidase YedK